MAVGGAMHEAGLEGRTRTRMSVGSLVHSPQWEHVAVRLEVACQRPARSAAADSTTSGPAGFAATIGSSAPVETINRDAFAVTRREQCVSVGEVDEDHDRGDGHRRGDPPVVDLELIGDRVVPRGVHEELPAGLDEKETEECDGGEHHPPHGRPPGARQVRDEERHRDVLAVAKRDGGPKEPDPGHEEARERVGPAARVARHEHVERACDRDREHDPDE